MPPYAGGGRAPAGVRSLPTGRRVSDCPSSPALAAVVHRPAGGSLPLLVTPLGGRGGLSNKAAASQNPGFAAPASARLSFRGGGGAPAKKLRKTPVLRGLAANRLTYLPPSCVAGRRSEGGVPSEAPGRLQRHFRPLSQTARIDCPGQSEGGRRCVVPPDGRASFGFP